MTQRTTTHFAILAALSVASCAAPDIAVRPAGQQPALGAGPGEGDRQLALGNVGLAIEAYGKALRAAPGDVAALAGLAAAYDRMGRFDLSRRYFEQALAFAPNEQRLYQALAGSLAVQGHYEDAARVRREGLARLAAQPLPTAAPQSAATMPRAAPDLGPDAALAVVTPTGSVAHLPLPEAVAAVDAPVPAPTPRPTAHASLAPVAARASADAPRSTGPRLVRLSPAEVALTTRPGPRWVPRMVAATAHSTTIRFDAVRREAPRVVLLNAARVNGLAATTRAYLQQRGFAAIRIGNAPAPRRDSVVLYPAGMRSLALRLAGQFDFAVRPAQHGDRSAVTVLLGDNAARDRALARARSPRRG